MSLRRSWATRKVGTYRTWVLRGGRLAGAVALACIGTVVVLGVGGATAGAAQPPCPLGQLGHQLVMSPQGDCIDNTPPSAEMRQILAAKQAYADAFAAQGAGTATQAMADSALKRVQAITGDTIDRRAAHSTQGVSPMTQTLTMPSYGQINGDYCGPATAQNMVRYLWGSNPSSVLDTVTGTHDVLNGDPNHDQGIFANSFWLNTASLRQTPWTNTNATYMPHALNDFTGTTFYYPLQSGNTDETNAWLDIDSDLSYFHPVAENVLYASSTFFPLGFSYYAPGYKHWDTIFGDNASFQAGIAQSYASPGQTRSPWQWWPWYQQWGAIAAWHGIVW